MKTSPTEVFVAAAGTAVGQEAVEWAEKCAGSSGHGSGHLWCIVVVVGIWLGYRLSKGRPKE